MEFKASTTSPPLGAVLTLGHVPNNNISLHWGKETSLRVSNENLDNGPAICRYLSTLNPDLHGNNALQRTEVDHWISFSLGPLSSSQDFSATLKFLDTALASVTFLVDNKITIADLSVFGTLIVNSNWYKLPKKVEIAPNVNRWFNFLSNLPSIKKVVDQLPQEILGNSQKKETRSNEPKEEGKFIDLPGAEMGKVVVRFPPEASGYLHIGHAKAALLNWHYREYFKGKLVMRFDDTNPDKEKVDFEKVILEDIKMLQIYPDILTYTSDYFPLMLEMCERLLKSGDAYVDDTAPEDMKAEREARTPSRNRDNTVERNFKMWAEMVSGTEIGQTCCVRAKINMQSDNGCMRDPTIYRCKALAHPRTGTKFKVYPTYDFACPIVDSLEGVTHALRSMEYHDRDEQFYWFIDILKMRKPIIWEYSRLNMMNTVLSKRKLTWFVEQGLVDSWEDPRFPTVRGVLRRGMTVQGLKQFIIAQGSSRSVVQMEWDKIWAFNKKVIDPIAPRYTALEASNTVVVNVKGAKPGTLTVPKHPKNSEIGTKTVDIGPQVVIAAEDVPLLKEGDNSTFINWGNLTINRINRDGSGAATSIDAELNLSNTDFKKTAKLTWLCKSAQTSLTPVQVIYYDHIITKPVLAKDEDFKQFINKDSKKVVEYIGDSTLTTLKVGEIIQLQRIGFFRVDAAAAPDRPLVLIHIPDGSSKSPTASGDSQTSKDKASDSITNKDIEAIAKAWREARDLTLPATSVNGTSSSSSLFDQITEQGNKVRQLKTDKASKAEINDAVQTLLSLKLKYKETTGSEWSPNAQASATRQPGGATDISTQITEQGNLVRDLKAKKANKEEIQSAVSSLLTLKQNYKNSTGKEWQPPAAPVVSQVKSASNQSDLNNKIVAQGDKVRQVKAAKAEKATVDAEVKTLLALKAEYKSATGQEWKPSSGITNPAPTSAPVVAQPQQNTDLNNRIIAQGDKVRQIKAAKADKATVDAEVKTLLALKAEYKVATGKEWKPSNGVTAAVTPVPTAAPVQPQQNSDLNNKIIAQGDKVRQIKAAKADKATIDAEVKTLLVLKAEYKAATGKEWKPNSGEPAVNSTSTPVPVVVQPEQNPDLNNRIIAQGDKVRQIKAAKADKATVDAEVKTLLSLKAEYKVATGKEWKPSTQPAPTMSPTSPVDDINQKITAQGDKIRDLKSSKADKAVIDAEVKSLLALKAEFKTATGQEWKPPAGNNPPREAKKPAEKKVKPEKKDKEKSVEKDDDKALKKQTRLGLEAKKDENLSDWYSQVITKGEMIEYYDVSGCYILRPWAFAIWEAIQGFIDTEIKKLGVVNAYFPMFVSKSVLEREKAHIADFAPEVAWVTKSGDSDLAEHIAIRPTSETVMYPAYSKWIQSHRDLPLRLNQWNNVVRWEFKHPQPFLRTREFLWQEGHTAFATYKEAEEEVYQILDLYSRVYTDLLAIPVVKGRKTEKEKFAGGDYTTTVEAFISASGRGIQGATSHHLGQNFSKMFDITVEDPDSKEKMFVYQNSWGLTTRTIGVMIMVHADNTGLVIPPAVSALQVVIVPCGITASLAESVKLNLIDTCKQLDKEFKAAGIRSKLDERDNYSPGWKFNHWELKGVPLRVELGPKDLEKKQMVAVRRDTGAKLTVEITNAAKQIRDVLNTIQASLLSVAETDLKEHTKLVSSWPDFCPTLDAKNIILAPFCEAEACEESIKKDSARDQELEPGAPAMGAKSLCIPFDQPAAIKPSDKCIHPACGKPAKSYTLFGRSY